MHFEGVTLAAVVAELKTRIQDSFIQQIYQPLTDLLLLQLYSGEKCSLLIAASQDSRVHLTQQKYENPSVPSAFCMLLRKHLKGGMLHEIRQPSLERIVDLGVICHEEKYVLRAELMGRYSNVILLRGEEILGALKPLSGQRKLLPHALYEPPPSQNKLDPQAAAAEELIQALTAFPEETLKKALLRVIEGIGPHTASELIFRARLKTEQPLSSLNPGELNTLAETVHQLFSSIVRGKLEPTMYLEGGESVDCTPIPFQSYSHLEAQSYKSMSEALDACHRERHQEPFEQHTRKLMNQLKQRIEKQERALAQVQQDLTGAQRFEEYKERGDLLMANLSEMKRGQRQVEVEDFATGRKLVISLDPTLGPVENAQRFYERYKKLKRGLEKLTERQRELEMELSYFQEISVSLEQAETLDELRELESELELEGTLTAPKRTQATSSGPHRFTLAGFLILVGRNGRQNDALIRQAHREDYWLHVKDRPGAHVLVTSDQRGLRPSERVLLRAAQLAAYYSRGRGSTRVPVTYTRVKYLKKPKGARPGLVLVMREEGTLIVSPQEQE